MYIQYHQFSTLKPTEDIQKLLKHGITNYIQHPYTTLNIRV